jgi:ABC-type ATPase with predicted acetyltransferase domain
LSENTEAAETATEGRSSVRQFRHDAKNRLREAQREIGSIRYTPEGSRLYRLVNGVISGILAGRTGLSQEGQVKQINRAIRQVNKNKTYVVDAANAAAASLVTHAEQEVENLKAALAEAEAKVASLKAEGTDTGLADSMVAALDETAAILTEARDFAQNRDFAAHQEAKGHRVGDDTGPDGDPIDFGAEESNEAVAPPSDEDDPEDDEY